MKLKIVVFLSFVFIIAFATSSYKKLNTSCLVTHERFGNNNSWVDVARYGKSNTKSILIIPPTGGANLIDESYAQMFCSNNYQVFILKEWAKQIEENYELSLHQKFYENSGKAIDLVLNEIQTGQIGIMGTSVGALHTAVAIQQQNKINAAFLIVGGAPLASIIVQSDQEAMQNLSKIRKIHYGFKNDVEYFDALSKELALEPMKLGNNYKNKKIAMLVALSDTKVPTELQKNLAIYFKPSLLIEVDQSHFFAIITTWLFKSDIILNFFETEFNT